jgi:hypothetical protein
MDPRIHTPAADLATQYTLSLRLVAALQIDSTLTSRVRDRLQGLPTAERDSENARGLKEILGSPGPGPGAPRPRGRAAMNLAAVRSRIESLYRFVQQSDAGPTPVVVDAAAETLASLAELRERCEAALGKSAPVRGTKP